MIFLADTVVKVELCRESQNVSEEKNGFLCTACSFAGKEKP